MCPSSAKPAPCIPPSHAPQRTGLLVMQHVEQGRKSQGLYYRMIAGNSRHLLSNQGAILHPAPCREHAITPGASSASGFEVSTVVLTKASHLSLGTTLWWEELEKTYISDLLFTCYSKNLREDLDASCCITCHSTACIDRSFAVKDGNSDHFTLHATLLMYSNHPHTIKRHTCFCGKMIWAEDALFVLGTGWLSMHAALTTCSGCNTL